MIERAYPGVYLASLTTEAKPIDGVPTTQPGAEAPAWTASDAHDPGITLAELFGFLSEPLLHHAELFRTARCRDCHRCRRRPNSRRCTSRRALRSIQPATASCPTARRGQQVHRRDREAHRRGVSRRRVLRRAAAPRRTHALFGKGD